MDQEVKYVNIKNLVLWTENPRDPIDENATDQDIVDRAIKDSSKKWTLDKLAKEMGEYYDFSELPTVVFHGSKPVVYDGNRRMILGKIKYNLVAVPSEINVQIPDFPEEIPCNVCIKEIALKNVYRKHSDSGSWQPLERDIFLHKFMKEDKSPFLILEEATGIISNNPHLNQRFVKDEVFREDILELMGFSLKSGILHSVHNDEEGYSILSDVSQKVENKKITTRKNRGKVVDILEPSSLQIIERNKKNNARLAHISFEDSKKLLAGKRQTRRTSKKESEIFGGKLYLRSGQVSDLYRDIVDLHEYYIKEKDNLSRSFPSIIRMALRLLCETAAKDINVALEDYVSNNYVKAKKTFSQDVKTTLSSQNVTETDIVKLLHTGAHNYKASSNMEQTIALSIAVGGMIKITHGKIE
ncbi:MAG: hypothetical protein C4557_13485 [Anaerolineaceae bacterium]|jgi:hypothetical protein|nr:MAG: hypothetical protein C4557_13485 [Anaerolineaceae bacterium]